MRMLVDENKSGAVNVHFDFTPSDSVSTARKIFMSISGILKITEVSADGFQSLQFLQEIKVIDPAMQVRKRIVR